MATARARVYGAVYLGCAAGLIILFLLHLAQSDEATRGHRDFLSFYTAARMAWGGEAAAAWDAAAHRAAQAAVLGAERGYIHFFYPPHFLLACLPVAALPLVPAYLAWVVGTAGLLAWALRRAGVGWLGVGVLVLSPAGLFTIATGQNAFLTTALLVAAGGAMGARPGWAGGALALLSMKPQLGPMVVPGLVAARRWGVLAWAGIAGLGLLGLSAAAFGAGSWTAFLAAGGAAQGAMEGELSAWKMQSVFALLRQWGGGAALGYAAQAVAAAAAIWALWPGLRRRPGGMLEAGAFAAGGLLMTPFLQFYDLLLLTVPMVAIGQAMARGGALPGERPGLVVLFLGPGASWALGDAIGVSLGPALALLAVWLLRRRMAAGGAKGG